MKNTINYFYNIRPDVIHQVSDIYKFKENNIVYLLIPFYGNINYILEIYAYLIKINIYCHEIIYNKDNSVVTLLNNKPYVLLKIHINNNKLITISDILAYNIQIDNEKKCNWYHLWCEKIDYYEYQVSQYGKKYPLIKETFSYYNGMSETAISLLKTIDITKVNLYISHNRITSRTNLIEFYNPLNMTADVKVRDICEYIKNSFFKDRNILNEVEKYFIMVNLTYEEAILFLARLIYPSYYFDLYDEIIQGKEKEDKLYFYTNKIPSYEIFLYNVINILNHMYRLPEIDWIIKT